MIYMPYDEFHDIDGLEFLEDYTVDLSDDDKERDVITIPGGYDLCYECDGEEDYSYAGDPCDVCNGNVVIPDLSLAGWCSHDNCQTETVNMSHGEWLCVEHDESRHVEFTNDPSRYARRLI